MQPHGNLRQANMNTFSDLTLPISCEDSLDNDLCYSSYFSNQGKLLNTLHSGSTSLLSYTPTRINLDTSGKHSNLIRMETHRNNYPPTPAPWDPSTTRSMAPPLAHSNSQSSFSSVHSKELNSGTSTRGGKPTKKPQTSSKRPTPDDFRNMVLFPREHEQLLLDYVGTDSKYTLAKNHAGMMVRSSIKSQDILNKMREVAEPLDAIDLFLGFLLEYTGVKQEQKGCVALRICFGALTALLGDFSQGSCVENFVSDPHAAVVPKEHLAGFRSYNPRLSGILRRLSTKLEKSVNLYRHRRSPSGSLVAKFQEMADTVNIWNKHLMDDTFAGPSQIASDWLRNHPTQVDSRRRNQAYNEQASPILPDTPHVSPPQCDSNYLSPMSAYGEPSRSPNRSHMHPPTVEAPIQYESLFRASPSTTGVTYFGHANMPTGSISFNNPTRYGSGLEESLSPSSLENGLAVFAHQSFSHSTGQYHGTSSGYPNC
ncbi:hypothetical protein B0J17DRAFT_672861 [Rhizoctonia solani]|nr:hypothetical protein B0J17DRAFT_672861 [Rhizoctonia solani]